MRLDPDKIAAEAHALVPSSARQSLGLLDAVERFLREANIPELYWEDAILRSWRPFPRRGIRCIVIRHRKLREWRVCISVQREGSYLAAAWYLIAKPTLRGDLRRLLLFGRSQRERETIGIELSAQRRGQLGRLSTLSRRALQHAIDEIAGRTRKTTPRSQGRRRVGHDR